MKFLCFDSAASEFLSKGPIGTMSALVREMAWYQKGDKPLPELKMTQFSLAHVRH